jgi:hypothetical protein
MEEQPENCQFLRINFYFIHRLDVVLMPSNVREVCPWAMEQSPS